MLDRAIATSDDACVLPLARLRRDAEVAHERGARLEIVQRCQRAIAVAALLGVGVTLVVEELIFEAGIRTVADEVFDAAVRSGRELEFQLQLERAERFFGNDIAATAAGDDQLAVFQTPALRRERTA